MTQDTRDYLEDQLSLFTGGYQHLMVEFTAHLTGAGNTVPVGIKVTDHRTGELIATQVPVITGDITQTTLLGVRLAEVLAFVRDQLSPF